jgi:hypothetical protein
MKGSSMNDDLQFSGALAYSDGVKFIAYRGDAWIVNRITRLALQDFFKSERTPAGLLATFACHRERIVRLARFRIEQKETNEWGGADITSEYLHEIQYEPPDARRTSSFPASHDIHEVADRIELLMCPRHYRHASVDAVSADSVTYRGCCPGILDDVENYMTGTHARKSLGRISTTTAPVTLRQSPEHAIDNACVAQTLLSLQPLGVEPSGTL